jgi:uncharacterized membrane protein YoaK (UPF0700 family)
MTVFFYLLGIIVWVVCIVGTYLIAKSKGRSAVLWTIFAVFFTWIVLLIVALLPARRPASGI